MEKLIVSEEYKFYRIGYSYCFYRVFHRFGQAKFADGRSILGSSLFTQLLQLHLKQCLRKK
jgi:hypothetical protein